MKNRVTEYFLANLASMSMTMRRGMPVLLLYSNIEFAEPIKAPECRSYHVLPPAPDRDTAERTRTELQSRGWRDFTPPAGLEMSSISLSPPGNPLVPHVESSAETERVEGLETSTADASAGIAVEGREESIVSTARHVAEVLEQFDGFVDRIDGDIAYITLKSLDHGDELSGQYPAAQLKNKGIDDQDRFLCKTVREGNGTRVDIEALPKVIVTREQLQEIDDELNRMLPDEDIDY